MWLLFISFVAFSSLPLLSFHCASPATRRHMGACESLVYVHICANTEDGRFKKKNQLPILWPSPTKEELVQLVFQNGFQDS